MLLPEKDLSRPALLVYLYMDIFCELDGTAACRFPVISYPHISHRMVITGRIRLLESGWCLGISFHRVIRIEIIYALSFWNTEITYTLLE